MMNVKKLVNIILKYSTRVFIALYMITTTYLMYSNGQKIGGLEYGIRYKLNNVMECIKESWRC